MYSLKRAIIFLILLFGPYISSGQNIDGVWMSYNNRVVNESEQYTSGQEGFILDFGSKTLGHISSDSVIKFKINRYKIKIKELNQKVRIKVFGNCRLPLDRTAFFSNFTKVIVFNLLHQNS